MRNPDSKETSLLSDEKAKQIAESCTVEVTHDDKPLRTALWWGRTPTVKVLVDAGANVHARNNQALRWAKHANHPGTARLLEEWIATGAPPEPPRQPR